MISSATIRMTFAVLSMTFAMAATAQDMVGLNEYYLGQPMQACPDNRPPVKLPDLPPTTCELTSVQTLAGQPVSSFVVAFGDGRVFAIVAHLPAGEGTRLKVRDALSELYGRPEGPMERDGYFGYVWKLSEGRLIVVEGDSTTETLVEVFDPNEIKRQEKKQSTAPKLSRLEVVRQSGS